MPLTNQSNYHCSLNSQMPESFQYDPVPFPPLGNLAASAREPSYRPPGRWERGIWMLRFWFTFLVTLLQLSIGGRSIYAAANVGRPLLFSGNRLPRTRPRNGLRARLSFQRAHRAVPCSTPSTKGRTQGLQLSWYFIAWLLTRCFFTAMFLISAPSSSGWSAAGRHEQLIVFGFLRVVVFNLPFAALLPGLLLVHAERQYPPEPPDAKLTEPEEPINPLA